MQGRIWDEAETHRGAAVVVVNQAFVKQYFPAGDAIGHTIKVHGSEAAAAVFPDCSRRREWIAHRRRSGRQTGRWAFQADLARSVCSLHAWRWACTRRCSSDLMCRRSRCLHSVRTAVNSIDPDQQTNNDVRDLEHWITRDA